MTLRLLAVTFVAQDPDRLASFWGSLLGRDAVADAGGILLPGDDTQVGLLFAPSGAAHGKVSSLHLHVTSDHADQPSVVAHAMQLGASHRDIGQLPDEPHVVLDDPEGNAWCVIPPGNAFLAGCGLLGEVACDGTRAVGVFWSEALGWPLVWDQDEETAMQSPQGGTKVAWGGPSVTPVQVPARKWFELVTDGALDAEVDRLIVLGAQRVGEYDEGVLLTDPDGSEFRLRTG